MDVPVGRTSMSQGLRVLVLAGEDQAILEAYAEEILGSLQRGCDKTGRNRKQPSVRE